MATAEQIKSLIKSHLSDDPERFFTLALQVAAHEALQGHGALAHDIRAIVDRARKDKRDRKFRDLPPEVEGLVQSDLPSVPLASLVLPTDLLQRISRVLDEYRQREKLQSHGLVHRRKLLLTGPPGTGKTLTARVLANELRLPLYVVQIDRLVTKFMGETSTRLRQVFDLIEEREGVYLFDEFDSLAGGRSLENDVGEMRRVLTSLLQFIERDHSNSLVVAATNSPELLDRAIFRRFDDVLRYGLPSDLERQRLIANTLGTFVQQRFGWKTALRTSNGLSGADIVQGCRDALKHAVLSDRSSVSANELETAFGERTSPAGGHRHSRRQSSPDLPSD